MSISIEDLQAELDKSGMLEPGNIKNLYNRPELKNPDGTISTTKSMSFEQGGVEILVPTVVDGKEINYAEAVQRYWATGEHLGKFRSAEQANTYARSLSQSQGNATKASSAPFSLEQLLAARTKPESYEPARWSLKESTAEKIYKKQWIDAFTDVPAPESARDLSYSVAKTLASAAVSTAELATAGFVGLEAGLLSLYTGGSFNEGLIEGATASIEATGKARELLGAITNSNLAPANKLEESLEKVVMLFPQGFKWIGEDIYERTGIAFLAAAAEGSQAFLFLKSGTMARAMEPVKRIFRGKPGPFENVPIGGGGGPEGGGPSSRGPKGRGPRGRSKDSKVADAFDEMAAKNPEVATKLIEHVGKADPLLAELLGTRAQEVQAKSPEALKQLGYDSVEAQTHPTRNVGTVEDFVRQIRGEGPGPFDWDSFVTMKIAKEQYYDPIAMEQFRSRLAVAVKEGKITQEKMDIAIQRMTPPPKEEFIDFGPVSAEDQATLRERTSTGWTPGPPRWAFGGGTDYFLDINRKGGAPAGIIEILVKGKPSGMYSAQILTDKGIKVVGNFENAAAAKKAAEKAIQAHGKQLEKSSAKRAKIFRNRDGKFSVTLADGRKEKFLSLGAAKKWAKDRQEEAEAGEAAQEKKLGKLMAAEETPKLDAAMAKYIKTLETLVREKLSKSDTATVVLVNEHFQFSKANKPGAIDVFHTGPKGAMPPTDLGTYPSINAAMSYLIEIAVAVEDSRRVRSQLKLVQGGKATPETVPTSESKPEVEFPIYKATPKANEAATTALGEVLPGESAIDRVSKLVKEDPKPSEEPLPEGPKDEPAAERIKSRPDANARRLGELLGKTLYETADMPQITIKETFQNSFDAVRDELVAGNITEGKIDIVTDSVSRTITIKDNGTGMTPEVLGTTFLEIGGTGKTESPDNSGGFGIAKMVVLYGNEAIMVRTLQKGVVSEMVTTGKELLNALPEGPGRPVDENLLPNIDTRKPTEADRALFPEGHGTYLQVMIPESYSDSQTGKQVSISMPDRWTAGEDITPLGRSPLLHPIEVTYNGKVVSGIGKHFMPEDYTQFVNVDFPAWGNARVYISTTPKNFSYGENLHILSNGLWQFSRSLYAKPGEGYGKTVPFTFYVDINSKVKPGKEGYPFQLNRRSFTESAEKDFEGLLKNLNALYAFEGYLTDVKSYGSLRYIREGKDGQPYLTAPEDIKPDIPPPPSRFNLIRKGDKVTVEKGRLLVNGKEQPSLSMEDMRKALPDSEKLKVDQSRIDSDAVILHDNVDVVENKHQLNETLTPLTEVMYKAHGQRFYDYLNLVGKAVKELRTEVAALLDYPKLLDEAVGLSFDTTYRGVSTRIPFSGSFVNPLLPESRNPVRAAYGIIGTAVHEFAHHQERGHADAFPIEMQKIQYHLDAETYELLTTGKSGFNFDEFRHKLTAAIQPYQDILDTARRIYESGNIKARGDRFRTGIQESGSPAGDVGTAGGGGTFSDARSPRGTLAPEGSNRDVGKRTEPQTGGGTSQADGALDPIQKAKVAAGDGLSKSLEEMIKSRDTPSGGDEPPPGMDDPTVFMNMGTPIKLSTLKNAFDASRLALEEHVPGFSIAEGKFAAYWDATLRTFSPEHRSPEAKRAGAIIASNAGKRGIKENMKHGPDSAVRTSYWNMNPEAAAQFLREYEKGVPFADPILNKAKAAYKAWNKEMFDIEQRLGLGYDAVENYLYHVFENGPAAQRFFEGRYGLRWGDPAFVKDRVFDLYEEAIAAGFKPKFSNPEDIMQARQHAHNIAVAKIEMLNQLAEHGLAIRVQRGEKTGPEGFAAIPRRSPNGVQYWVHADADVILTNYYDTRSLWTMGKDPGANLAEKGVGTAFRGFMFLKNSTVPLILSFSGFHGIHVLTIDNIPSAIRGVKEWAGGSITGGQAIAQVAKAFAFADILRNPKEGARINNILRGKIPESEWTEADKVVLQAMVEGGFVPLQSHVYQTNAIQNFRRAIEKHSATALWHAPFAAIQLLQKPMFGIWIPNLKAASYARDTAAALRADPTLLRDTGRRMETFRAIAKSVDNRYGEMAYDTLFWDRWVKDLGVAGTLSLGWNLGFVREYLGAPIPIIQGMRLLEGVGEPRRLGQDPQPRHMREPGTARDQWVKENARKQRIKERIAKGDYDKAMFATMYIVQALGLTVLINYLLTGEGPKSLLDFTHPRTGEKDEDGKDKRLNTMFYTREFMAIYMHMKHEGVAAGAVKTVVAKAAPSVGLAKAWVTGLDSLGNEIRDPNANFYDKLQQTLLFSMYEIEPISVASLRQQGLGQGIVETAKENPGASALTVLGFGPAPKYITDTPTEAAIKKTFLTYFGRKQTAFDKVEYSADARVLKQLYRNGKREAYQDGMDKIKEKYKLYPDEMKRLRNSVESDVNPLISMFARLSWQDQQRIMDKMTPEELEVYKSHSNKDRLRQHYRSPEERQ